MAVAEMPQRSGIDLQGVSSLAGLFLGKNSTTNTQNSGGVSTTGSRTVSESVDPAAVDATVKSILEGTQGLAAVAGGQKRAGLYNSSTNQLLTNDLIARAAAEGAKLNKSTTTTINENQVDNRSIAQTQNQAPPVSAKTAGVGAGILGSLSLIPPEVRRGLLSKIGINTGGKAAAGSYGADAEADLQGFLKSQGTSEGFASSPNQVVSNAQSIAPSAVAGSSVMDNTSAVGGLSGVDYGGGFDDFGFGSADSFGFDYGGDWGFDWGSGDDFSNFYDMGAGGVDWGFAPSVGSDWASIDWGIEDFGSFFAEGGLIERDKIKHAAKENRSMMNRQHYEAAQDRAYGFEGKTIGQINNETSLKQRQQLLNNIVIGNPDLALILNQFLGGNTVPGYAEGGQVRKDSKDANDYPYGGTLPTVTVRARRLPASAPRNYAAGGLVNRHKQLEEQEAAIVRGDDPNKKQDSGEKKPEPKQDAPAQRSNAARIGDLINNILGKRRGYAEGGPVNTGLRVRAQNTLRDPLAAASNEQDVTDAVAKTIGKGGTVATNQATRGNQGASTSPRRRPTEGYPQLVASGDATSVPGVVGTPAENEAAVAGLALGLANSMVAAPLGLAAMVSNNLGLTNINTLSPISHIVQAIINSQSSSNSSSNPATSGDDASSSVDGIGTSTVSSPMGSVTESFSLATGDTVGDSSGTSGVGTAGGGGVGDSSGAGVGSDGDGGVGAGGAFKQGGEIDGPGSETSDSIPINVSDGEFVVNAAATKMFLPIIEHLNNIGRQQMKKQSFKPQNRK